MYTVIAVLIAMIIAIPVGLVLGHTGRGSFAVAGLANGFRAVPAFGLMILLYVLVSPKIHYRGSIGWLVPRGALGSLVPVEADARGAGHPADPHQHLRRLFETSIRRCGTPLEVWA